MVSYITTVTEVVKRMDSSVPEVAKFKKLLNNATRTNNPIEVFIDLLSQPSRALHWTILLAQIPNVRFVEIRLPSFPKGFETM
jgi:hypothetical protein